MFQPRTILLDRRYPLQLGRYNRCGTQVILLHMPPICLQSAPNGKSSPEYHCASASHILVWGRYPSDNCYVIFPGTTGLTFHDPQTIFADYLSHDAATGLVSSYLPSIQLALGANKPFIMFETNTASCGGFKGISDSFGAALWALDYGLQMAAVNFAEALLHVSGQGVYYNVSLL